MDRQLENTAMERKIMRLDEVPKGTVCIMVGIAGEEYQEPYGKLHLLGRPHGHGGAKHGPGPHSRRHFRHQKKRHMRMIVKRLCDLGLTPGTVFKKIEGLSTGPVVIEVRGTKLALGHGVARHILVEKAEE